MVAERHLERWELDLGGGMPVRLALVEEECLWGLVQKEDSACV